MKRPKLALSLVALMFLCVNPSSQTIPNFSGTWTRDSPRGFTILSRVDSQVPTGSASWGEFADSVKRLQPYTVTIHQTADEISIVFFPGSRPGDSLSLIPYRLDGVEHATVQVSNTVRGMWTKFITNASWNGPLLTVAGTHFSGFYQNADPATVIREPEHSSSPGARNPSVKHVLALDLSGVQLTITTTIGDETGEIEYRQVFSKSVP